MVQLPDHLYHYYEHSRGPLRNLSDLAPDEAEAVLEALRQRDDGFASQRNSDYLSIRRELEAFVRARFIDKGGEPLRNTPHYFTLGACDWVETWYAHGSEIHIPLAEIDVRQCDQLHLRRYFPGDALRRRQTVSPTGLHAGGTRRSGRAMYGLPQEWNADGKGGPDRYIEAQVWYDPPAIKRYISIS